MKQAHSRPMSLALEHRLACHQRLVHQLARAPCLRRDVDHLVQLLALLDEGLCLSGSCCRSLLGWAACRRIAPAKSCHWQGLERGVVIAASLHQVLGDLAVTVACLQALAGRGHRRRAPPAWRHLALL